MAIAYVEMLLEDPDYIGIFEMFEDEGITEKEWREVYDLLPEITIKYPEEWE